MKSTILVNYKVKILGFSVKKLVAPAMKLSGVVPQCLATVIKVTCCVPQQPDTCQSNID